MEGHDDKPRWEIGTERLFSSFEEAMEESEGKKAIQDVSDHFLRWESSCHFFCPPTIREESVEESFGDLLRRWCLTSIVACL
jgi:hypothetical protein